MHGLREFKHTKLNCTDVFINKRHVPTPYSSHVLHTIQYRWQ